MNFAYLFLRKRAVVDRHDVADAVESWRAAGPFTTSARTGSGVDELFAAVASACLYSYRRKQGLANNSRDASGGAPVRLKAEANKRSSSSNCCR